MTSNVLALSLRRSFLTVSLLVVPGCAIHTAGRSRSTEVSPHELQAVAAVNHFADSIVGNVPVAGLSIVVRRGDRTVLSRGYGFADVDARIPMTDSTASRIGSITKSFTAIATMKLVERGLVDLDSDVGRYLPELKIPPVTVRQALNHTSGLPDHERRAIARWFGERKPITKEFVVEVITTEPASPAGQHWVYNNAGFHLLGLVVEKAAGMSYEEFVDREIVRPLGLRDTWVTSRPRSTVVETKNYYLENARFVHDSAWDLPGIWAAGGMFSSARDLADYIGGIATGKAITGNSRDSMLQPTVLPSGTRADYGLGLRLGSVAGHPKWGHTGSARSTRAAMAYYPHDSLTVVVLMNTEHEDLRWSAIEIEGRVARTVLGLDTSLRKDLKLDPGKAAEYVGGYADAFVQNLITEKDGVLYLSRVGSNSPPVGLLYQGGDIWADPEYAEYFFVFQRANGKVTSLARYDNGYFVGVRTKIP